MDKIGSRLTLAAGLTVLLAIAVFAWFSIRAQSASLLAQAQRHAQQLSETVKLDTEYDMLLNHRERIRESIARIGHQPGLQRVRVMNKSGAVIYSSDPLEVGKSVDKKAESCNKCHAEGRPLQTLRKDERFRIFRPSPGSPRLLGVISPITNAPSCWTAACHFHPRAQVVLGVLDVTLSLEESDRAIRSGQAAIGLLALGTILGISLIIGLFVRLWVDVPVQELLKATRAVAGGDLDYAIVPKGSDELWSLARSFNDMTRRLAQTRLQLLQSEKLASLGRLAAGVAHEINNPLTAVLTYSSLLAKRSAADSEAREDLDVIVRETVRCREIVKSLLDFARQSVPRKVACDVGGIIERAAAVVAHPLALNRIRLVKQLDPALPQAVVDANQLQQVFVNLLVNASDAIGAQGGTITVIASAAEPPPQEGHAMSRPPQTIEVKVQDTGCGIPQGQLPRLFEPFGTTKGQKGTGLGLAVTWGIVENHGGTIGVESAEGVGTTFTVRLPVKP